MISTDLANLSDWVLGNAVKGRHIHATTAAHLAKVLLDLSHQAAALERLPVEDADLLVFPEDCADAVDGQHKPRLPSSGPRPLGSGHDTNGGAA